MNVNPTFVAACYWSYSRFAVRIPKVAVRISVLFPLGPISKGPSFFFDGLHRCPKLVPCANPHAQTVNQTHAIKSCTLIIVYAPPPPECVLGDQACLKLRKLEQRCRNLLDSGRRGGVQAGEIFQRDVAQKLDLPSGVAGESVAKGVDGNRVSAHAVQGRGVDHSSTPHAIRRNGPDGAAGGGEAAFGVEFVSDGVLVRVLLVPAVADANEDADDDPGAFENVVVNPDAKLGRQPLQNEAVLHVEKGNG